MTSLRSRYAPDVALSDLAHYVYLCYDDAANLLYVGMTSDINSRFGQHRAKSPWFKDADGFDFLGPYSRTEALEVEQRLIWERGPLCNQPNANQLRSFL
jgi:hypothetical protein